MTKTQADQLRNIVDAISSVSYDAGYSSAKSPTDEPSARQTKRMAFLNDQLEKLLTKVTK